jgi:2-dehydropantoate 2-reductase
VPTLSCHADLVPRAAHRSTLRSKHLLAAVLAGPGPSMTRVAVVGAGAMGSLLAAHLSDAGAEVWAFDTWREHVDAIRRGGLCVRAGVGERAVPVHATCDPAEAGTADVALVMVKYRQTRAAMSAALPMVRRDTLILTLQNGIGNVEAIREIAPENRVLYGFTTLTSEMLGPGRIEASYAGKGETYLWPADGRADAACAAVADCLNRGGIRTALVPDIELRIWKKLVVNCCYNPLCALAGQSVGELIDRPEMWPLLDGVTDEIVAAAQRKGIPLERGEAGRFLRQVGEEARAHFPSMLIDFRRRRPTEIDCLNGAVLRECERLGIAAPINRALVDLVRAAEAGWQS